MSDEELPAELRSQLISACRTAIGDRLRSMVYFTAADYEQIYLRSDLEHEADIERFVNNERLGFTSMQTYGASELGDYYYTIRAFEYGYITRVIEGDHGVFVTTDEISVTQFEHVARALRRVLREF